METRKKTRTTPETRTSPAIKSGPHQTGTKITENKHADSELRASQALLQTTLDSSFNFIQVFKAVRDKHGKIIDFTCILNNRKLIEKEGDRVGKNLLQMNPGVVASGIYESFVQVTESGIPQTNEVYYEYEGYQDWFHHTIAKLDDGFVLTGEIITDRKKVELERLRLKDELAQKATDHYLTIFNSIDEGFHINEVIFDENNKAIDIVILEENPAAQKILGGSFIGKTLKQLNSNYPEERLQIWSEVIQTGESRRLSLYSDIWKKWLDFHIAKIGDENSRKVALVFQDISERKNAEEALRKSEARLFKDLSDTKLLQSLSSELVQEDSLQNIYQQLLNAATVIMHSDMGSIQLYDPEKNELFQLLTKGFDDEMANQWEWIKMNSGTVCCMAFKKNKRVIVPDVEASESLRDTEPLRGYRLAGIRALQSTPLITRSGQIVGMISTHWKVIHQPSERELHLLDILARQAADIIERKHREEKYLARLQQEVHVRTTELKESKELLQNIAQAIPDMVSVQSYPARKVIYFNREPYTINGLNADDLAKMTPEERNSLVHPEDIEGLKKYIGGFTSISNEDILTYEYRVKNKSKDWIWLRTRGKVFERDEEGNVTSFVNVIQNIDAQKESEEKIKELNTSLLSINKELSSINAELKNFNTITANNYTEILRHIYINLESIATTDARNLSDTSKGNLRKAQAAIQKMKLLTNDINHFLELFDLVIKKELADPNNIISGVKAKLKKKIEDSNTTIVADDLPQLNTDPVLFSKLMTNIIDNAIKFKKPGFDPVIHINYSLIADTASGARHKGVYTNISVTDNGIGFKQEDANKAFELFTQLDEKHKGSGIGLAVCKKIMEMHGGFMKAVSEPGKGTSIHCYFPA